MSTIILESFDKNSSPIPKQIWEDWELKENSPVLGIRRRGGLGASTHCYGENASFLCPVCFTCGPCCEADKSGHLQLDNDSSPNLAEPALPLPAAG